jgi:hypothetical protein
MLLEMKRNNNNNNNNNTFVLRSLSIPLSWRLARLHHVKIQKIGIMLPLKLELVGVGGRRW